MLDRFKFASGSVPGCTKVIRTGEVELVVLGVI